MMALDLGQHRCGTQCSTDHLIVRVRSMADLDYVGIFHCDSTPSYVVMQALPDMTKEKARYHETVSKSGKRLNLGFD